jgi:predicted DNA-binding protein
MGGKTIYPTTSLALPPELRETVRQMAKERGLSFSQMVTELLQTALDYHY